MKNYFLPMLLSLFFLGACDKNDEIIPEDADENFITSVVMTVDGKSYTADIADNTVTITVPYTVSLNNAEVEFKYTTSATIIPDPETVTDWDNERTMWQRIQELHHYFIVNEAISILRKHLGGEF